LKQDERYVQRIKNPTRPDVIQLDKNYVPLIVNLLMQQSSYDLEHERWKSIFTSSDESKKFDTMKWFLTALTKYFLKKQEVWGYVNPKEDNRLEAVLFWEPPENSETSLTWLLNKNRLAGFFKMGPGAYGHLVDKFTESKKLRQENKISPKAGVIHYFAVYNKLADNNLRGTAIQLLESVIEYFEGPTYAFIFRDEKAEKFLEEVGFKRISSDEKSDLMLMERTQSGKYYDINKPVNNNNKPEITSETKQEFKPEIKPETKPEYKPEQKSEKIEIEQK